MVRHLMRLSILLLTSVLPLAAQSTPVINKLSDLNLGAILAGASAGTATLDSPTGSRSNTGGTELSSSMAVCLGSLTLTGKAGNSWSIAAGSTLPFTLNRVGGGTLTVTAVDFEPSTSNTGVFPASRTTARFFLGAAISVGTSATTPKGTYTGSFLLLLRDTSNGGKQSTQVFTVTVHVDPVITLSNQGGLGFGDIFAGTNAGKVVLSPEGVRNATGGLHLGDHSAVSAAAFTVNGAPYATYAIILPSSIILMGPSGSMEVSRFTSSSEESGFLDEAGTQRFNIGATLKVNAHQSDGDYRGTFAVTVIYN
jgi:hypothetical protein